MKKNTVSYFSLFCFLLSGCNKFLDVKPSISHLQRLMDNVSLMNSDNPALLEIANDDTYLTDEQYNQLNADLRKNYTWDENADYFPDFYNSYMVSDNANEVLNSLSRTSGYNDLKGTAFFYRAYAFYNIAQLYCLPYLQTTLKSPGIFLLLYKNDWPVRSSVEQSYQQIISDLNAAVELLPEHTASQLRPCKNAAYAMLSRVYLCMQDYSNAERYADSSLKRYDALEDYNTVYTGLGEARALGLEVIFHVTGGGFDVLADSLLYRSYSNTDLRKSRYFENRSGRAYLKNTFKRGFYFDYQYFNGLATDEMYLNRAEARIRNGNIPKGIDDLNALLITRYEKGKFIPFDAVGMDRDAAIRLVLQERRKSLLYRGLRWSDVRRLNAEGKYPVTLAKKVKGKQYTLLPNDLRYVMLIPQQVMKATPMIQNPR